MQARSSCWSRSIFNKIIPYCTVVTSSPALSIFLAKLSLTVVHSLPVNFWVAKNHLRQDHIAKQLHVISNFFYCTFLSLYFIYLHTKYQFVKLQITFFCCGNLLGCHQLVAMSDYNRLKPHIVSSTRSRGTKCTLERKSLESRRVSGHLRF